MKYIILYHVVLISCPDVCCWFSLTRNPPGLSTSLNLRTGVLWRSIRSLGSVDYIFLNWLILIILLFNSLFNTIFVCILQIKEPHLPFWRRRFPIFLTSYSIMLFLVRFSFLSYLIWSFLVSFSFFRVFS